MIAWVYYCIMIVVQQKKCSYKAQISPYAIFFQKFTQCLP